MTAPLGNLLTTPPPALSVQEAGELARLHFGVTGRLKPLTSERDQNFHLIPDSGPGYVLKLVNPAEPPAVTDFQTRALLHLEPSGLPVPRVCRTLDGQTGVQTPHGHLRLLTWLEGLPLSEAPRSPAQRRAIGAFGGRLSAALSTFAHPAADHALPWDIARAAALRPLLVHVADDLRPLATATLDRFEAQALPGLPALRWQVCHNDMNPTNVLVDPADPTQVAGLLDFGDMVRTPVACDLGVDAAYQIDPAAALDSLVDFVAAWHSSRPLTRAELALVPLLTATRMLTTICITSWRAVLYPDNAAYILRNHAASRAALQAMAALDPAHTARALAAACPDHLP